MTTVDITCAIKTLSIPMISVHDDIVTYLEIRVARKRSWTNRISLRVFTNPNFGAKDNVAYLH